MKISWLTETGGIVSRWSEAGERDQHNAPWIHGKSESVPLPSTPDFARHSPFGSGEWFAPWNARWSVPGQRTPRSGK